MIRSITFSLILIYFLFPFSLKSSPNFEELLKGVVIISGVVEPQAYLGFASKSNLPETYRWLFQSDGASGFLIAYQGKTLVVTNSHVVELFKRTANNQLAVITFDGSVFYCKLLGADSFYDLAILEFPSVNVSSAKPLALRPNNQPLRLGEVVYTIGHPYLKEGNFQYTITQGIVSGLNRKVPSTTTRFNLIQHTAPLASGNSGGPLLDANGFVCGINSMGSSELSFLNYSIDINFLLYVLPELLSYGSVQRVYLGLEFKTVSTVEEPFYKKTSKVFVSDILSNSPIAKLIKVGDEITAINDSKITDLFDLVEALETLKPNKEFTISVIRNGKPQKFSFTPRKIENSDYIEIVNYIVNNYSDFKITLKDDKVYVRGSEGKLLFPVNYASFSSRVFAVDKVSDLGKVLKNATLNGGATILTLPESVDVFDVLSSPDNLFEAIMKLSIYGDYFYEIDFGEPNSIYIF